MKNLSHEKSGARWFSWIFIGILAAATIWFITWRFSRSSYSFAYQHQPADCLIYQLDYRSSSAADFSSLFESLESPQQGQEKISPSSGLFQSFRIDLKGEVIITILERSKDRQIISFRLENPVLALEINGGPAPLQTEITSTALRLDVFADLDPRGRFRLIYFDSEVDNFSRNLARALMAGFQFVLPDVPGLKLSHWEVEEEDPVGRCLVRYELLPQKRKFYPAIKTSGRRKFSKTKVSYLETSARTRLETEEIPTTIIPGGSRLVEFDFRRGLLLSMDATEKQEVRIAGKKVGQGITSIKLVLLKKDVISTEEVKAMLEACLERKAAGPAFNLSFALSEEEREAIIQRSELGEATKESLFAELEKAEREGKKSDTSLYLKFKALVFVHPELCPELAKMIAGSPPGSLKMRILTEALSGVGHEEAQKALIKVIQEFSGDSATVGTIIESLGRVKYLIPEAVELVQRIATESENTRLSETALLSLGNMARNLAHKAARPSSEIVAFLVKETKAASSEDRTRTLLLALGNTGSSYALKTLLGFAANPSPELRSAAVAGLRWIESEEAEEWLIKVLTSDKEASVRLEAVFALSFKQVKPQIYQAIRKAFLEDRATIVRLSILENLLQPLDDDPEVRQLIKQAATGDLSEEVRKAASNIIDSNPDKYFDGTEKK